MAISTLTVVSTTPYWVKFLFVGAADNQATLTAAQVLAGLAQGPLYAYLNNLNVQQRSWNNLQHGKKIDVVWMPEGTGQGFYGAGFQGAPNSFFAACVQDDCTGIVKISFLPSANNTSASG